MILVDTHVLLWWQAGGQWLSQRAAREIAKADRILVSPMSLWEIGMLLTKDRIALDRDVHTWADDLLHEDRVTLAPVSAQTAVSAALLGEEGFHGDPADRFLYAAARELLVPLATKDRGIRAHAARAKDVRAVW